MAFLGDTIPPGLEDELRIRHLDVRKVSASLAEQVVGSARALIVPFLNVASFSKTHAHLRTWTLDSGASFVPMANGYLECAHVDRITTAIRAVDVTLKDGVAMLAQRCADHSDGYRLNASLIIDDGGSTLEIHEQMLMRRAFSDFARIEVRQPRQGFSGAKIWRVVASDSTGRKAVPFAVKLHRRAKVELERENIRNFVTEQIPFPHRPPVLEDRCVVGGRFAVLVTAFVERAEHLDEYLSMGKPAATAIDSLFDGPLRVWRAEARGPSPIMLAAQYEQIEVLPKSPDWSELDAAYRANGEGKGVPAPADLRRIAHAMPRQEVRTCWPHGDLHAQNVFVRQDSGDVILIDFARCRAESPLARDLAQLDVSIGFGVRASDALGGRDLERLYSHQILRNARFCWRRNERIKAIQKIRSYASMVSVGNDEYELTVAFHLLRLARVLAKADTIERAAATYEVGARLVLGVARRMDVRP